MSAKDLDHKKNKNNIITYTFISLFSSTLHEVVAIQNTFDHIQNENHAIE